MKSKGRRKGKELAILLLIVAAFVGVLIWGNHRSSQSLRTQSSEKKAESPVNFYYKIVNKQNSNANDKCVEGLEVLGVGLWRSSDGKVQVYCAPGTDPTVDEFGWNNGSFKLSLGTSPRSYVCKKSYDDEDTELVKTSAGNSGKLKVHAASNYTYKGKSCDKDKFYYEFDLSKVPGDSDNAIDPDEVTSGKDAEGNPTSMTGTVSVKIDDLIDKAELKPEQDDPEETLEDKTSVVGQKGDYEIVSHLDGNATYNTYKKAFESMYNASQQKARTYVFEGNTKNEAAKQTKDKSGKSKTISLSCNYKLTRTDITNIEAYNRRGLIDQNSGKISYYYYDKANLNMYKGYWEKTTKESIPYKYHYMPAKFSNDTYPTVVTKSKEFNCKRTCTEYVKVEYGPPVQVDAGMCFEYRLKVSSVTNCTATANKEQAKPETSGKKCVLKPKCGAGLRQAGPTEDFDNCVQSCDGGKYTEACSNKCYDEVYGEEDSNNAENVAYDSTTLPLTQQVKFPNSKAPSPGSFYYNDSNGNEVSHKGERCVRGQHYVNSNGKYSWCPLTTSGKVGIHNNGSISTNHSTKNAVAKGYIGIWYWYQNYNTIWFSDHSYASDASGNGYIRHQTSSGQCRDKCSWNSGCNKYNSYYYFNYNITNSIGKNKDQRCPKMYVWDNKNNKYVKENICTTDDLIKADIKNNMRIYNEKVVKACEGRTSCEERTAEYTIDFKYKDNETQKVDTVHFPYTKSKDEVYSKDKSMPTLNNNPEVIIKYGGCYSNYNNRRWYYTEWTFPGTWLPYKGDSRVYGKPDDTSQYSFVKGKVCIPHKLSDTNKDWANYYIQLLNNTSLVPDNSKWKFYEKDPKTEQDYNGYNIFGSAKNFGLFRWTFNMKCFYALTNNPTPPGTTTTTNNVDPSAEQTTIKTYDTADPFLQNTAVDQRVQYKKQTRAIGFNWTSAATLGKYKDAGGGYDQNPSQLLKKIQTTDTFSRSNLDFEFKLDVKTLRKLRQDKRYNYSKPKYTSDGHGVSHYTSSLLRNGITKTVSHFNKCNNKTCKVLGGE